VLELRELSLQLGAEPDAQLLLAEISARWPTRGHYGAILGPSGCGKSTLLKVIAGVREHSVGHVIWEGRDLSEEGDLDPHEIGYVPQFSIAYDLLTVQESVESALRLRVAGLRREERAARVEAILLDTGLQDIAERRVTVLSGGQKRRLALALEMVSSPRLLLCDEVTSGLDPKAEDEIARLLHDLSRRPGEERLVLSVTHSLRHLALFDSVLVLYQGHVAYHGSPEHLFHYFGVEDHENLFPRLAQRRASDWHRSWLKHRNVYYGQSGLGEMPAPASIEPAAGGEGELASSAGRIQLVGEASPEAQPEPTLRKVPRVVSLGPGVPPQAAAVPDMPGVVAQFGVLLRRRWRLFVRDRGQLALQLALLFGFPFLVVVFALEGLPALKSLAAPIGGNFLQQLTSEWTQRADLMRTGSLVSGLVMFQVVLLALMGSNNAAREIANERLIFEKEKFAGLRPLAYIGSKAAFLAVLVLAQSIWMGVFVHWIVRFPGDLMPQLALLTLVNAALTAICLGISSLMRTAEQASLVSIYLVGFQLPLSGAVLALPAALGPFVRPLIASYWGWSGFIQTLRDTRYYEAVGLVTQTKLAALPLCLWVLASHVVIGLCVAYAGSRSARWE
jgi:ABC-type multidrug transport system ATPase subunit